VGNLIQILGAVAITIGAGLIFIPAGFIIGGALAVLLGIALERK
jgi:hypothetical protein